MTATRPREAAVEVLITASDRGRFVDDVLAEACDRIAERRDRALVTELVHGTSRARGTLDFIVSRYRKLRDVRPAMRWILRVAIYQLGFTDRLAARVAVSAAVDQARARFGRGGAGLANAILRNVQREWERVAPDRDEDPTRDVPLPGGGFFRGPANTFARPDDAETLAARYAYPAWLIERWLDAHSPTVVRAIAHAQNRRPDVHCRVAASANAGDAADRSSLIAALAAEGIDAIEADGGLRVVAGGDRLASSRPFREGRLFVQDPTQAAVVPALGVEAGDRVLEIGAAPGTKTVQLAAAAGASGWVLAVDRSRDRIRRVRENLDRAAAGDAASLSAGDTVSLLVGDTVSLLVGDAVSLLVGDAGADLLAGASGRFARALVDAPCSNTGVLARRSDARWRVAPDDFADLVPLQCRLLSVALNCVRPGGVVVYSTCSIDAAENEGVVERVLAAAPAGRSAAVSSVETTLPGPNRDGGFRAVLRVSD